jgi:hypothetical protein
MSKQMFTMKSEVVGHPWSVMILFQVLSNKKNRGLSCEFSQNSRTLLYEITEVRLGYHKFCARLIPKMLMGA